MDYEGYTFVFLSKYKQDVSIKWDIYYVFTFQRKKFYTLLSPFNMNRMKI